MFANQEDLTGRMGRHKPNRTSAIKAKKKFGQHFLHDQRVVARLVDALDCHPGDAVIEIGPGLGALTHQLIERQLVLHLIEADIDMVTYLKQSGLPDRVTLHHDDALQIDLAPLLAQSTCVISNLPYQVSVPITARLIAFSAAIPRMVLMYQREVAERIRSQPKSKSFGPISVLCQTQYQIRRLMDLGPGAFSPPPKVQSQVLLFDRLPDPAIHPTRLPELRQLLEPLFQQRRKMVLSTLRGLQSRDPRAGRLIRSYETLDLPAKARPEELRINDYVKWLETTPP